MTVPMVHIRAEYRGNKLIGFGVFNGESPNVGSLIGVLTLNEFEKLVHNQGYTKDVEEE